MTGLPPGPCWLELSWVPLGPLPCGVKTPSRGLQPHAPQQSPWLWFPFSGQVYLEDLPAAQKPRRAWRLRMAPNRKRQVGQDQGRTGDAGFGVPVERPAGAEALRGVLAASCHPPAPASPPPLLAPECVLSSELGCGRRASWGAARGALTRCLPPACPALVGVPADPRDPGHGASAAPQKQARAALPQEAAGGGCGPRGRRPEEAGPAGRRGARMSSLTPARDSLDSSRRRWTVVFSFPGRLRGFL